MNLGYTGKPYDSATGLYNYGYRDYKPELARFTTVDPIRDGSNWFAYVNNDPVNWVDPWGLDAVNDTGHAQVVRHENGEYTLASPHETISGKIDGVMTQDYQTRKVSDHEKSPFTINLTISQKPDGTYGFSMSFSDHIKNALGNIAKFFTGSTDWSGTFPDKAAGTNAASWWSYVDKEFGDPSTWDQKAREQQGQGKGGGGNNCSGK
jgi:RHS repeat-associated protein